MAAIITDQLRILNAKNFVAGVASTANSYYSFVGLPNPTDYDSDWDTTPPAPIDNFNQEDNYWDTMVALKKINKADVRQVVRKLSWTSGITYDMYRNNISGSDVNVQTPKDMEHGDLTTNIAMILSKKINKNPLDIALEIINSLKNKYSDDYKEINIAGPGFINVKLNQKK